MCAAEAVAPEAKLDSYSIGRFGVGRRDITPPADIYFRSWGAATSDVASGIHRPFSATVLSMQAGDDPAPLILVAIDAGWWQSAADEWMVRGPLIEELGVDPARVMISLSHTHAGPSLVSENADRPGGQRIRPYLEQIGAAVLAAAREALAGEVEAELRWVTGTCDLASDRKLPDPDPERDRYLTGYNPAGDPDATLLVGRVATMDGAVLATLVNYACHPTTLAWDNSLLSPDYVGAMRETVERDTAGAPCLFLLGACGELAPAWQYAGDVAVADRHGRRLGLAALSSLEGMLPPGQALVYDGAVESGAPLAVWSPAPVSPAPSKVAVSHRMLSMPIKSEYPPLGEILAELEASTERYQQERLQRKARLRRMLGDEKSYDLPLWVWRLGETFYVGYPGEAFSSLQRDLRAAFPDSRVVVMNLVNGSIGYLPPAELYGQDMYEVWQTPLDRGCFESLRDACVAAMRSMGAA